MMRRATTPWYTGPVERAARLGITTGYPDGTFRPSQVVSRAEMAALILRAIGEDSNLPAFQGSFSDAPEGAWFIPYVERLLQLGIIGGPHRDAVGALSTEERRQRALKAERREERNLNAPPPERAEPDARSPIRPHQASPR